MITIQLAHDFIQRRINVEATFYKRHVPAGQSSQSICTLQLFILFSVDVIISLNIVSP